MTPIEAVGALEQQLLNPRMRADVRFLDRTLASNFLEIGQSVRMYDKLNVMQELQAAPGFSGPRTMIEFRARTISPNLILAIYRIAETGTVRSSLWRKNKDYWQLPFHQGTRPFRELPGSA